MIQPWSRFTALAFLHSAFFVSYAFAGCDDLDKLAAELAHNGKIIPSLMHEKLSSTDPVLAEIVSDIPRLLQAGVLQIRKVRISPDLPEMQFLAFSKKRVPKNLRYDSTIHRLVRRFDESNGGFATPDDHYAFVNEDRFPTQYLEAVGLHEAVESIGGSHSLASLAEVRFLEQKGLLPQYLDWLERNHIEKMKNLGALVEESRANPLRVRHTSEIASKNPIQKQILDLLTTTKHRVKTEFQNDADWVVSSWYNDWPQLLVQRAPKPPGKMLALTKGQIQSSTEHQFFKNPKLIHLYPERALELTLRPYGKFSKMPETFLVELPKMSDATLAVLANKIIEKIGTKTGIKKMSQEELRTLENILHTSPKLTEKIFPELWKKLSSLAPELEPKYGLGYALSSSDQSIAYLLGQLNSKKVLSPNQQTVVLEAFRAQNISNENRAALAQTIMLGAEQQKPGYSDLLNSFLKLNADSLPTTLHERAVTKLLETPGGLEAFLQKTNLETYRLSTDLQTRMFEKINALVTKDFFSVNSLHRISVFVRNQFSGEHSQVTAPYLHKYLLSIAAKSDTESLYDMEHAILALMAATKEKLPDDVSKIVWNNLFKHDVVENGFDSFTIDFIRKHGWPSERNNGVLKGFMAMFEDADHVATMDGSIKSAEYYRPIFDALIPNLDLLKRTPQKDRILQEINKIPTTRKTPQWLVEQKKKALEALSP